MTTAYSYIRWSSEKQTDGDSLRRQTQAATDYAARHGLTISEDTYLDAGVSAAKGKNVEEGALRAFLDAVDAGKIAKGSYLLVENFDRLTRLKPSKALRLLQDIVDRGITLVTLTDGKHFSTASLDANWTDFIVALAVMARSHEENKEKGRKVKAAWDAKRASGRIMSANGPAWLQLSEDRSKWLLVPEKVKAVQKVFELAASGLGSPTIADKMNDLQFPTMSTAPFWEAGIVAAMLKNPAVIGRLVPRKAQAEPTEGYYPQIVKPDVFHLVQEHVKGRAANRGKTGTNVANLFAGIIKCECGARMRFVSGAKPHLYLRCLKAYSNAGCDAPVIPYLPLEADIMGMVLTWAKLPLNASKVEDPTIVLNAELAEKRRQLDKFLKLIEGEHGAPKSVLSRMSKLESEIDELEERRRTAFPISPVTGAAREAALLWGGSSTTKKGWGPPTSTVSKLHGEDLKDMRYRLQAECKRMFSKIVVLKTMRRGETQDYLTYVLYGPIVEANPFESAPMFTEDGGWREEFSTPRWGFGRRRKTA